MEKGLIVLVVIALIICIVSIVLIFVIHFKNKMKTLKYRMEISESSIYENLKEKFDLVTRCINIIERELKLESKKFEAVKKIRNEKISNIVFDNVLEDATEEIFDIKDDYKEIEKIKSFKGIINDIKNLNILLSGGKKFYNKYASEYNNLTKAFPYKFLKNKYKYKELYLNNIIDEKLETGLDI